MLAGASLVAIVVLGVVRWRAARPLDQARARAGQLQVVANLPWVTYGLDFGEVPVWGARGIASRTPIYEGQLRALREAGGTAVAWFLLADGRAAPEFDGEGTPVGFDDAFWSDYDAAIALARRLDLRVVWVLLDQLWMYPRQVPPDRQVVSVGGHADVLEVVEKRRALIERVLRPLFARHADEPRIAGWILVNEPDNPMTRGWISKAAMYDFIEEAVQVVRREAPRQPLGIAFNDLESLAVVAHDRALDRLDFLVFHHYAPELPPPADVLRRTLGLGAQPIYIGEFDVRLAHDPVAVTSFLRWTRALGYDGAWPWSLNAPREAPEAPLAALPLVRSTLQAEAAVSNGPGRPIDFGDRRTSSSATLEASGLDWRRWLADGAALLKTETAGAAARVERRRELTEERVKLEGVVAEQTRQLKSDIPRCTSENGGWVERARGEERERARRALALCERYRQQSLVWKAGAEARLRELPGLFLSLERQEWRAKLYLPFWTEELAWARRVGLER
jgi:hypothetical protein